VETVSQDGQKALVKMLPPDPGRKDVIHAERLWTNRERVRKIADLHRSKEEIVEACEFQVGDVVIWCYIGDPKMATVTKVQKKSAKILNSEGVSCTAKFEHMMLVSRQSNEVDPGVMESEGNHYKVCR
jgi:sRNA-binding protein